MALIKCRECGKEISDESKKCIHCGADVILSVECPECHKKYDNNTNICPHCGKNNSNNFNASVNDTKNGFLKAFKKNGKKIAIIFGIVIALFFIGLAVYKVITPMLVSVDEHLSLGEYDKAYEKAKSDEDKKMVLLENIIAKNSYQISDGLKDPSSFKLSHVYYDGKKEIVFEVVAKNSYGGNVTNYYDYRFDDDEKEYSLYLYLSSLEDENYYSYDTYSEKLEKILKNVVRATVKSIISDSSKKLDDKMVDRINNLFGEGKLRDVKLIPQVSTIYPLDDDNDSA